MKIFPNRNAARGTITKLVVVVGGGGRPRRGAPQEQEQHRQTDDQRRRRTVRRGPVGDVAQRRLAARLTGVNLDPLADHDAPVLAFARAVPFQRPQLLAGRGALVARRVRVPFHLRR